MMRIRIGPCGLAGSNGALKGREKFSNYYIEAGRACEHEYEHEHVAKHELTIMQPSLFFFEATLTTTTHYHHTTL